MLPDNVVDLTKGIEVVKYPAYTYKLQYEKDRIMQYADGLEAMKQFVYKTLMTERYKYLIYDWNYGFEVDDLFGKPKWYAQAELPRRIRDALMSDDRVTDVDNFEFPPIKRNEYNDPKTTVHVTFTVHTIYGSFQAERTVKLTDV